MLLILLLSSNFSARPALILVTALLVKMKRKLPASGIATSSGDNQSSTATTPCTDADIAGLGSIIKPGMTVDEVMAAA